MWLRCGTVGPEWPDKTTATGGTLWLSRNFSGPELGHGVRVRGIWQRVHEHDVLLVLSLFRFIGSQPILGPFS